MNLVVDEYSGLDSPFHRWDARYKLIGFVALVFAFSFIRDLRMVLVMAGATAVIYAVSRLPGSFLARRMRYPSIFLVAIMLTLPFLSGQNILATWGPMAVREEGLLAAILIAARFTCIVTIGVVLLGTTPLLTNIKAMRALGLPQVMADMALLSFRYIQEIGRDLHNMQVAMRLRGFTNRCLSLKGLRTLAWLSGSLLVYSYEHSESIYQAMILRGYGNAPPRCEFQSTPRDRYVFIAVLIITAGFIIGDMLLGHQTAALLEMGHGG